MNVSSWEFEYVRRYGKEVGLIAGDTPWTNADVHDRARRLAHALIELGVQGGDRVAIALPNCVELFICASAVWIAGGVVVVMAEPSRSELQQMLRHCEPRVLITRTSSYEHVNGSFHRIVARATAGDSGDLLRLDDLIDAHTPWRTAVERAGSDPAQLCYTSGVTGLPKAAVYTHAGTDAFLRSCAADAKPYGVSTAVLVVPSTAFGARFIGMRFATNIRYVLLERSEPEAIMAAIERHKATEISLVPTMAEQISSFRCSRDYDTSSLRTVHMGGSHVSKQLVAQLKQRFRTGAPGGGAPVPEFVPAASREIDIFVRYGMTEAGGGIAGTPNGGDGVVGPILPGVKVRCVDEAGRDVPPGTVGEILVCSAFVASGYWQDEINTAAVFRDGYVHTGDLGTFNEASELCIVGRLKDVIIQGGYNVTANEVIGAISGLEGVAGCAVVGMPNDLLGEEVVACVVPAAGARISERIVLAHCRKLLNPRKQPTRILFVHQLPTTHNGKPDAQALRQRIAAAERAASPSQFRRHLDALDIERRVALIAETVEAVLAHILQDDAAASAPRIEREVPFGEMGLDSIGAVRVAHALSGKFGATLSPTILYSNPTVATLATRIHTKLWGREPLPQPHHSVQAAASGSASAVAVVGIGCRLPGGIGSPAQFWELLAGGVDAVREAPVERRVDSSSSRRAGFLEHADHFDGKFFRLEDQAAQIDPRHRMILEVAWEALEDAGRDPSSLEPARTGVFLGMYGSGYRSRDRLATAPAMAVAYLCQFLDLRGPVVSVDTTCSSSLVAVHAAVASLRLGECDVAIVGGANLLADTADQNSLGVVSPDGRSRAFDASANGFGQGEGCVLLVLKRHTDAEAQRDRIYAVIRGSAINHDGRSSSLTAPNARAQEEVIRRALGSAGIDAASVQYVEAHGTGTLLGDPIEVEGLTRVFGERTGEPLRIGSVKTNIGHLEAAAGVVGLAKVALALHHRRLPPSLHFSDPNPHIPWSEIPIRVQTQTTVWPDPAAPLIAGVSSFGMSGTNAHVVLEESSIGDRARWTSADASSQTEGPWVLPLSARTDTALRAAAASWADALASPNGDIQCRDVAFTASCRRAHLKHRLAVVGSSRPEWIAGLRAYVETPVGSVHGIVAEPRRHLVMVFSGQGTQWHGMGRDLLEHEPVFRAALVECARLIEERAGWKLLDELGRDEASSRIDDTEFAQPAIFALQVGLLELWRSWGVTPTAVVGHSLGEIAAAYAAGVVTLAQAVWLARERGRLLKRVAGRGAMAAVSLSASAAEKLCESLPGRLEVAASNGPAASTVSGDAESVSLAIETLRDRRINARRLRVSCAFHSYHVDEAATELTTSLQGWTVQPPKIPLYSTVSGGIAPVMNAEYWGAQCRRPVRFLEATRSLLADGASLFLEVGPHPALIGSLTETIEQSAPADAAVVGSLVQGSSERESMASAFAQLHCAGYPIDWSRRYVVPARNVSLPLYRWDHRSFWSSREGRRPGADSGQERRFFSRETPSRTRESLRNDVVRQLARLAHVSEDQVAGDVSLESLGLDSLAVIRLRATLSESSGVVVSASSIDLSSTLDQIVATLAVGAVDDAGTARTERGSPFRWLRREGAGPVHVWIHPIGGGVDCYHRLARVLPCPSAAIESPGLRGGAPLPATIERMAELYLSLLDEHDLTDVVLGGWSFGGLVALEMAAQLRASGRSAAGLVLIDTYPPKAAELAATASVLQEPGASDEAALLKGFVRDYLSLGDVDPDALARAHGETAGALDLLPGIPRDEALRLLSVFRTNLAASRSYRRDDFAGPALLIRARRAGKPGTERIEDWARILPGLEVALIEGDHYSIMKSDVVWEVADVIVSRARRKA